MKKEDTIRRLIAREAARLMYEEGVEIECTIYPLEDMHRGSKSNITGKPMERVNEKGLRRIIGPPGSPHNSA